MVPVGRLQDDRILKSLPNKEQPSHLPVTTSSTKRQRGRGSTSCIFLLHFE